MVERTREAVLYADDDRGLRRAIADDLRDEGYDVFEAKDPEQAKAALSEQEFSVILLDLVMPEHNVNGGEEVLKFMRDRQIETPVLLLTAFGYNGPAETVRQQYSDLVMGILTKSFESVEVSNAVSELLSKKRAGTR